MTLRLLALLLLLPLLAACNSSSNNNDNGQPALEGIGSIEVEAALALYFETDLPLVGTLTGTLQCAGRSVVAMTIDGTTARGECTDLPAGTTTVIVRFDYQGDGEQTRLFTAERSFIVVGDQVGLLRLGAADYAFPDDNDDGTSNFDALLAVTVPPPPPTPEEDPDAFNAFLSGLSLACAPSAEADPTADPASCNNLRLTGNGADGFQPTAAEISGLTAYTSEQPATVDAVTVTATAEIPAATITVNGTEVPSGQASPPIALAPGAVTTITIAVTATSGLAGRTWTIAVTRERIDNADLAALSLSVGSLDPAFDPAVTSYRSNVANNVSTLRATAVSDEPAATITINGEPVASGEQSALIPLAVSDANRIEVVVTAVDGTTTRSYEIIVTRIGSANLSALSLVGVTAEPADADIPLSLNPSFAQGTEVYAVQAENRVVEVFVTADVVAPVASMMLNGQPLEAGNESGAIPLPLVGEPGNLLEIVASHPVGIDGPLTRTYRVTVIRQEPPLFEAEAWLKPPHVDTTERAGRAVALSADGLTLAVGVPMIPVNLNEEEQQDNSPPLPHEPGRVVVYGRAAIGDPWVQTAVLSADNSTGYEDGFGRSLVLSPDGQTLVVGAPLESGGRSGIHAAPVGVDDFEDMIARSGAVHVYRRNGGGWDWLAYIKSVRPGVGFNFGHSVALSADGETLAIGEPVENSNLAGFLDPDDPELTGFEATGTPDSGGAVHLYDWAGGVLPEQQFVIKAPARAIGIVNHRGTRFGSAVALSADGNLLAIGMPGEDSNATGINSTGLNTQSRSGAAYAYVRADDVWNTQPTYFKGRVTRAFSEIGASLAVAGAPDSLTLAVGAPGQPSAGDSRQLSSSSLGIYTTPFGAGEGAAGTATASDSGAVYVFRSTGVSWLQEVFIKASNSLAGFRFGEGIALSADGAHLVVGAPGENSSATTVDGNQLLGGAVGSGAVYTYGRDDNAEWSRNAYLKVPNSRAGIRFGSAVALSADGEVVVGGAPGESSDFVGVVLHGAGEYLDDDNAEERGAAYTFRAVEPEPED